MVVATDQGIVEPNFFGACLNMAYIRGDVKRKRNTHETLLLILRQNAR